jgi:hypothetical protein
MLLLRSVEGIMRLEVKGISAFWMNYMVQPIYQILARSITIL